MAEYIEKKAAIDALGEEPEVWSTDNEWDMGAQEQWRFDHAAIKAIQPADVRPVVLCDKCRWFDDRGYPNPDPEMPELRMGHCRILGRDVQACWFCATGEREGGDAE